MAHTYLYNLKFGKQFDLAKYRLATHIAYGVRQGASCPTLNFVTRFLSRKLTEIEC